MLKVSPYHFNNVKTVTLTMYSKRILALKKCSNEVSLHGDSYSSFSCNNMTFSFMDLGNTVLLLEYFLTVAPFQAYNESIAECCCCCLLPTQHPPHSFRVGWVRVSSKQSNGRAMYAILSIYALHHSTNNNYCVMIY